MKNLGDLKYKPGVKSIKHRQNSLESLNKLQLWLHGIKSCKLIRDGVSETLP